MDRHRKQLEVVLKPETKLRGEALPSDVHKVIVCEKQQQEWSSSLDQEDTKPPHIKEEQEELRVNQEGEQLRGLEEADITKFPFTPVPVKSEDDEENPQFSQLHQIQNEQIKTEADGEDCGRPEPAMNSDKHSQPDTDDETGDSSEPVTDTSADWKETRVPPSGLNSLKNDEAHVSDSRCTTGEKEYEERFGTSGRLNPSSLSYPLALPLSFARSRESKGHPNSRARGVGLRGRGRYPLKPSTCASLLETEGYPEYTAQPATMAARSTRESHKWTPKETRQLIHFRAENEQKFLKSKYAAKQLWETLMKEMGLEGKVTGQQASKKWENLKQRYKELRTPKTGSGTDMGEVTAATWQFYEDMHKVLGARPSLDPPLVGASFYEDPTPILMETVEPSSPASTSAASRSPLPTPSSRKKRRKKNPILDFLTEESKKEQRRHEERQAKTERFLCLFEKMIDKL
ncbi:uncharacterized protein LOC144512817 [Sander vitreus]